MFVVQSIADVLEAAVRIERQGIAFYSRPHEQSKAPEARDIFRVLAAGQEESGHVKKLVDLKRGMTL